MSNYEVLKDENGVPIKAWVKGVPFEGEAQSQLLRLSKMPFVYKHLAVMPDCHAGKGSTVGSVIATRRAIIPATVGVDLSCGMYAVKTDIRADELPDSLAHLRSEIESVVPHGGPGEIGSWKTDPALNGNIMLPDIVGYGYMVRKYPAIESKFVNRQFGTLGGGNHFLEICLDENNMVWVMVHSGSRGAGNRIGSFFIEKAKEEMRRWFINLPDIDLAYLPEGSEFFNDYVNALEWAGQYAEESRLLMARNALFTLAKELDKTISTTEEAVHCNHNYIARENHFGENVWVTRKGAVCARKGQMGIIPGSMGQKSYIVRGKGNEESFMSCSHGAGRKMSRAMARKKFTLEDHIKATEGVECRKDEEVIDETPMAYKDLDNVMAAQSDLVDIVHTLKAVLTIKG